MSVTLEQEVINELVERFYEKLTKDSYYSSMFAERGVDIELLKERQRKFINRLANEEDSSQNQENKVKQVHERHPFQTTPERAEIWMNTMKETMNEMQMEDSIKEQMLEKIDFLMKQMLNR